jgi:hypothetical protein
MAKSINGATKSDDIDLDKEWQEAWKAARNDFLATYGEDLDKPNDQTPEDVLDLVSRKRDKDDADNAKHARAKSVVANTLTIIVNLGAIAAQGAGLVFGPANMCFNALSLLIRIGTDFKNIFAQLIELFAEVSSFLDRFKVYQRIGHLIDRRLKGLIHEALLSFVSTCRIGAGVMKHKVKRFVSMVLFSSDGGVKEELSRLRDIAHRESELRGTLSHEAIKLIQVYLKETGQNVVEIKDAVGEVHTITKGIDENITRQSEQVTELNITTKAIAAETKKVVEHLKDRELTKDQKDQLNRVKTLLAIKDDVPDLYDNNITKKIPNTGGWLLEHKLYTQWADRKTQTDYLLCIQGDEKVGKTFATYTCIQDLITRCQPDMNSTFSRLRPFLYCIPHGREIGTKHVMDKYPSPRSRCMETCRVLIPYDELAILARFSK